MSRLMYIRGYFIQLNVCVNYYKAINLSHPKPIYTLEIRILAEIDNKTCKIDNRSIHVLESAFRKIIYILDRELQCLLNVKQDISIDISTCYIKC